MHANSPPQGTQAVVRALGLLRAFTPQKPERSLAELCSFMGLKKATAHRLLSALESEGFLARQGSRSTYHLGPELIALGSQALLTSDLRASTRPTMERLAERTGETVTLEVLVGDQVAILDGVRGSHVISAESEVGTRWPAHATSTGKSMLACLPEPACEYVLARPMHPYTPKTLVDAAALRSELEEVRRRGYAVADQELEVGYVAVAAAVCQANGDVLGAISVGGPVSRFSSPLLEQFGEQVCEEVRSLNG